MKPSFKILVALCGAAILLGSAAAEETTDHAATVNKLRGQAKPGGKTRGFVPRGSKPAQIHTETRSVLTRGVPQNIQVSGGSKVQVTEVAAAEVGAGEQTYQISYKVDPESNVTRTSILFVKNSTQFANENSRRELETLAKVFEDPALAEYSLVIEGHSSAEGETLHNQQLSQERAAVIVAELVRLGVAQGKLLPVGFGESKARYQATDPESVRSQDRRVEIFRLE
jgi:outer membrane protein OmpA-like peptidoglycan-associated protein